jgi:hypothetical protein
MVCSIFVSSGRIAGAKPLHELDEVLPSTAASVLLFERSLELRLIAPRSVINRNALDHSWPMLDRNHRNYTTTKLKQHRETEKTNNFFFSRI